MAQLKIVGARSDTVRISLAEGELDLHQKLLQLDPNYCTATTSLTLTLSGRFYVLEANPTVLVNDDYVANTVLTDGDSISSGPFTIWYYEESSSSRARANHITELLASFNSRSGSGSSTGSSSGSSTGSSAGSGPATERGRAKTIPSLTLLDTPPTSVQRREDSTQRTTLTSGADDLWYSLCRTFTCSSALWLAYDGDAPWQDQLRSYPYGSPLSIHIDLLKESAQRGCGLSHSYPSQSAQEPAELAVTARPLTVEGAFYGWLLTSTSTSTSGDSQDQEQRGSERSTDLAAKLLGQWSHSFKLHRQIPQHFTQTLEVLVSMLEAKDTYTAGHSKRVAEMASGFGQFLGLSPATTHQLAHCAALHDIGKIAIPDHILKKPAPLTKEEFAEMKLHPVIGAAILRRLPGSRSICPGIRHHHENDDGSGYPDGLKGDQVPFFARIVHIIDAYDALVSGRTYSGFVEPKKALTILSDESHLFDRKLLTAFIEFTKPFTLSKGQDRAPSKD